MAVFIILFFIVLAIASAKIEQEKKKAILQKLSQNSGDALFSSDGCKIPKEQDLTCRRYGHQHETGYDKLPRYIVHEEPTKGYVILNGKKVRLKDCGKY